MTIALRQRPLARVVQGIVQAAAGCWLDPSDMTTLYRDAAGTTPVTAVEQPVGLILDKSRGMMLGPELVVNGDFSNGSTGWTLEAGWSVVNNELQYNTGTGRNAYLNIPTIAGKAYLVTYEIKSLTNGGFGIYSPSSSNVAAVSNYETTIGKKSTIVIATGTSTDIRVRSSTTGTIGVIDNISIRELYGNHATQSITASRPTLSARKNILLATETLATQSVTTLAATYTLSFTGTGSVTLSGASTGTLTGNGTDRVSLTFTPTAGTLTLTVSGSVTKSQLELGASAGPYQRVNTATDYDTDERYFPKYLSFDGIDDYLNLPYMGLYANGSASVVAGVSEINQTTYDCIVSERSSLPVGTPAYLFRTESGSDFDVFIRNDDSAYVNFIGLSNVFADRNIKILSAVDSGVNLKLFKNGGIPAAQDYTRSGTLSAGNTTIGAGLYGSTIWDLFNMKLYGLIITKSALSDAQRIQCERLLARKAGVTL